VQNARVGLVNCGLSTISTAWETMTIAWEVSRQRGLMRRYAPDRPSPKGWDAVDRTPTRLLNRHPVELLIANRSESSKGTRSTEQPDWFRLLKQADSKDLPRAVMELSYIAALAHHDGGSDEGLRKRMRAIGYCQHCALVSNTDEGGAVSSDRQVTLYTLIRKFSNERPRDLRSIFRGPYPRY
jgi:hypothetical protein